MTPSININSGGGASSSENESGPAYGIIGGGGDNLSSAGTSPRSISPNRHIDHQPSSRTANLLNLDESSEADDSHGEELIRAATKTHQPQQQTSANTIHSDFGLLLDLGEPSPVASAASNTNATTPVQTSTSTNNNHSDLESLLGGFDTSTTAHTKPAAATPTNHSANPIFDPFGSFDVPSSNAKSTPPLITPNIIPTPFNTQKSQSSSQGFGSKSNTNIKETPSSAKLDPFANLTSFNLGSSSQTNVNSNVVGGSGGGGNTNSGTSSAGLRANVSAPRLATQTSTQPTPPSPQTNRHSYQ